LIKQHILGDNNGQLIMCVPGCGGTGKSQLIRALTKYFLLTKRMQMMRKLAPTGIAAAEIDGMTIHSFLGEQRNSAKPRTLKPGDSKLEKEWRPVEYLLIDEMSMVGLTLLGKLNRIICSAKHVDPQVPFGGVNVIFFGDYLQYRPVYDSPLHTDFLLPSKMKQGKPPSEKEIQQRVARSLILQINCVVKLAQQMRTEDSRYLQLLDRLRHGQCNYDDYELLQTRVVGQQSIESLHDSPWNKVNSIFHIKKLFSSFQAPILVFRNEVRTQLNNKAAIHNATQIGDPPMVCVAQDTCKGEPIEDSILVKKLLELSDSKTEHLPGLLPFVPGMPVILTQNIATELGLINGINGIFRQLVYHEQSVSTETLSEVFPNNTRYIRRPIYALIEINKSKIECKLEDLEPKLIPIPLVEQTFRVDVADILPEDKRPKSNQKKFLSIKRSALPLVPAYCITTHKSQGQTLNKVVVDLKLPNESDDIAAVYVPLSRVKRLIDLAILRPFDYKVLLIKPGRSQVAEMERLDQLYTNTQERFSEWFR
jgi:ATP-dependent exoDNAse (exonuclease V) alpha subunit